MPKDFVQWHCAGFVQTEEVLNKSRHLSFSLKFLTYLEKKRDMSIRSQAV